MKIRQSTYLLIALLPLCMAGCSSDETVAAVGTTDSVEERVPVEFSSQLPAVTRATTIENVWTSGDVIAVSNGSTLHRYIAAATSTAGAIVNLSFAGEYSDQFFWPTSDPSWTFTAWYPYNNGTQWTAIEVAENQNTIDADVYKNYDLLYATYGPVQFKKRVHFVFYHQLAHVIVNATVSPASGDSNERVTAIEFGRNNVALTGSLTMGTTGGSVATPSVAWTVAEANKTHSVTMRYKETSSSVYTYECMLPPQAIGDAETPLLTIKTIDDEQATRTYLYKSPYTLQAGYEYTFDMSVNELGVLKVNSLTITGWGTGAGGTGTVK